MDTKELRQAKAALELDISIALDGLVKAFEEATGIIVKGVEMETRLMKFADSTKTVKTDSRVSVELDI